ALRRSSHGVSRALAIADLHPPERRVLWYLLLAWELKNSNKSADAVAILERLMTAPLPHLTDWEGRCGAMLLSHILKVHKRASSALREKIIENRSGSVLREMLSENRAPE